MNVDLVVSVLSAMAAAVTFALAAVFQQHATLSVTSDESLKIRLFASLLRQPMWILATGMMVVGFGFQALALAFGPVALVVPIVVTELAFAIPLAIWRCHQRAGAREWVGIACVVVGISVFLLAAAPVSGVSNPPGIGWLEAFVPIGAMVAVAVLFASSRTGSARAMALGAAAGMSFGMLDLLTKTLTHQLSVSIPKTFIDWQLYAIVGIGIVAFLFSQSAYQAGPLSHSLPMIDILEPVIAVVVGDTIFGEQARLAGVALGVEALAALIAALGIVLLARSPAVISVYEDTSDHSQCRGEPPPPGGEPEGRLAPS